MFIIAHRRIFFAITGLLVAGALGAVTVLGLPLGIDFTGGTLTEVSYEQERPNLETVQGALDENGYDSASVRPTDGGYIVRTKPLDSDARQALTDTLSLGGGASASIERFSSVGPALGQELQSKALLALSLAVFIIIAYVAFAFRHVSRPISSWIYGIGAIAALLFDVLIPVGTFAVLGAVIGAEVDALFVMALLAILGYSVNDTIVIFDRIRENVRGNQDTGRDEAFELTVGKSLDQALARSINTSLTTTLVLLALFTFGASTTEHFALTLLAGVIAGTYSSLCFAAPALVAYWRWRGAPATYVPEDGQDQAGEPSRVDAQQSL